MTQDEMKKAAAIKALEFVKSDTIIGVGTGSTVNHFIEALASRKDDIIGAVSAGMKAAWLQRSPDAIFDPWEISPTVTFQNLSQLPAII